MGVGFSIATSLGALFLAATGAPNADQWAPFSPRRYLSPTGCHYVLVHPHGRAGRDGIAYEFLHRRSGAPPLAEISRNSFAFNERRLSADPNDTRLGQGKYPQLPLDAHVLDKRAELVLVDQYGSMGYGFVFAHLDANGRVITQLTLDDLFGCHREEWTVSVSSIHWLADSWIDEPRCRAIVVDKLFEARSIGLDTGDVRAATTDELLTACAVPSTRELAFDVCASTAERDPRLAVVALGFTREAIYPASTRFRAAAAAARHGAREAARAPFLEALSSPRPFVAGEHLARYAPAVLGELALSRLMEELRREPPESCLIDEIISGLESMGSDGVAMLGEIGAAADLPQYWQVSAQLAQQRARRPAAFVESACASEIGDVARAWFGTQRLPRHIRLACYREILARGALVEKRIALELTAEPDDSMIPFLEVACSRTVEPETRLAIENALHAARTGTPITHPSRR